MFKVALPRLYLGFLFPRIFFQGQSYSHRHDDVDMEIMFFPCFFLLTTEVAHLFEDARARRPENL